MRKLPELSLIFGLSLLSACSSGLEEIKPTAKIHEGLDQMSCAQIIERAETLAGRATLVSGYKSGRQERGSQIIKFVWPPAFKVQNNPATLAELQLIRGEVQALSTLAISKKCSTWLVEETSAEFTLMDGAAPPSQSGASPDPKAP